MSTTDMKLQRLHQKPTNEDVAAARATIPAYLQELDRQPSVPHLITVSEGSLARLLSKADKPFAILTAYRGEFDKPTNVQRNLRGALNQKKMGVYQLVGHWLEVPAGADPNDYPRELKQDVVERSYWVSKPDDTPIDEFQHLIAKLVERYGQEAYIFYDGRNVQVIYSNGHVKVKGPLRLLGKDELADAYSQYISRSGHKTKSGAPGSRGRGKDGNDIKFVFEGVEAPATNLGRMWWRDQGLIAPPASDKIRSIVAWSIN